MAFIYLCVIRQFDRQFFLKIIKKICSYFGFSYIFFYYKRCNFLCMPVKNDTGYHPFSFHILICHNVGNFEIKYGKYSTMEFF